MHNPEYADLVAMIDDKKYSDRLQTAIGNKNASGKKSADKIDEDLWRDEVIKELNHASLDCADKLQEETGQPHTKYWSDDTKAYDLNYEEEAPQLDCWLCA
jgi:hypothetical protein